MGLSVPTATQASMISSLMISAYPVTFPTALTALIWKLVLNVMSQITSTLMEIPVPTVTTP